VGKARWALVLAAFVSCATGPARAKPGDLGLIAESYLDKRYEFPCPVPIAERTPKWKEGDEVPLSPNAAVQAARTEIKTLFPDGADWTLNEIKMTNCADASHWCYLISFSPPDKRTDEEKMIGHPLPRFAVPVLLNGVVVSPDITDRVAHK